MAWLFTFLGPHRDRSRPLPVLVGGRRGGAGRGGGALALGRAGEVAALQVPEEAPEDMRAAPGWGRAGAQAGEWARMALPEDAVQAVDLLVGAT